MFTPRLTHQVIAAHLMLSLFAPLTANSQAPADAEGQGQDSSICPKQLQQRSIEQVLEAHLAAFRSGNAELLACDYAKDAVFMMPGTVVQGREQIQAVFAGFFQSAGAINAVDVSSLTTDERHALMAYSVDSQHVVVTNGVDTFVVVKGRIVLQTVYLGGFSTR